MLNFIFFKKIGKITLKKEVCFGIFLLKKNKQFFSKKNIQHLRLVSHKDLKRPISPKIFHRVYGKEILKFLTLWSATFPFWEHFSNG